MKQHWQETLKQLLLGDNSYCHLATPISEQQSIAAYIKANQGTLMTEWIAREQDGNTTYWYILYYCRFHWICSISQLNPQRPVISDLSSFFPVANRLQRAIYDLTKIATQRSQDERPWLSHGHHKTGILNPHTASNRHASSHYHFHKVSGDGVHEVPVGPVHAGVIEPGHFRFSAVGERVLKLEERLGYTHKGIHQLLIGKTIPEASRLLARVSGDTTVAYSLAFALACEKQLGIHIDNNTAMLRTVLLERERLINHIGDIGAIINDTGFASLCSQFLILKETLVRENEMLIGHRYMMDSIIPTQSIDAWSESVVHKLLAQLGNTQSELTTLQIICARHYGLQDRLRTTGIVSQETALSLGLLGVAAKASGVSIDARVAEPYYDSSQNKFTPINTTAGDVAARVHVRFQEALQSIEIIKHLLTTQPKAALQPQAQAGPAPLTFSLSCVEGWRGPICVAVKLTPQQRIAWCHFHDPSWQNWLAIEYAVIDNIIADFPLINKSFNLSYSGQDC